ncbi:cellulose binding domain-containing protein [Actinomadura opuntiae]|uniref:cellulose binding domain-containing protein n=1 Tax=Actinomadura sp. OS1-43 TaxID=604315 RepID=UPI00255AAC78|nr:cellulose binding domain-containing protein [Actinomadura sp. OS1-43]MDL4818767.1 cellulose binding domain-containing protein [Actinomadura sp. OS1-43]
MSGEEPGYVPPDHTTTVEFLRPAPPAVPEDDRADPDATAPDPPASSAPQPTSTDAAPEVTAPDPVEPADPADEGGAAEVSALDQGDRRVAGEPAVARAQGPEEGASTARFSAEESATMANPGAAGRSAAALPRGLGVIVSLVGAVLVMLAALGAVSLLSGGGSDEDPGPRAPAVTTTRASGGPSARRPAQSSPTLGAPTPSGPVVNGAGVTYQLVQQDEGYYEGRLVITNRTGRPMNAWRISFDAPGADVRNVWNGRLVRGGPHPVIESAGADPIPPGGTLDVEYGASGVAAAPRHCLLNGAACGF